MKIAVIGAGAVGGYFGALLARGGHELAFIARGAQLEAMRRGGLQLRGPRGESTLRPVTATDSPDEIGVAEVVLFCVKCPATETAARAAAPLVGPNTMLITLQNGVDSAERLAQWIDPARIVPGAAFVSAVIGAPGRIDYTSAMSSIVFGEPDGGASERTQRFAAACVEAGFAARASTDIRKDLWGKFVALATNAALTGLVRQPAGVVYRDSALRRLAQQSIAELAVLAQAAGVKLDDDQAARSLALLDSFPPGMYASLYHDLAAGKPTEIEYLSGHASRLGKRLGVATPFHDMVHACLAPYADGAPRLPG